MKLSSASVEDTIKLGQEIGLKLVGGEFITLIGDLGGGKTHFTKGLAIGLGIKEEITSPTFVIERIYESPKKIFLHHFDFYRLGSFDEEIKAEVTDLSLDNKNIIVVEWAKNLPKAIPGEYLQVNFEYVDDVSRDINLFPKGNKYSKLIKGIK